MIYTQIYLNKGSHLVQSQNAPNPSIYSQCFHSVTKCETGFFRVSLQNADHAEQEETLCLVVLRAPGVLELAGFNLTQFAPFSVQLPATTEGNSFRSLLNAYAMVCLCGVRFSEKYKLTCLTAFAAEIISFLSRWLQKLTIICLLSWLPAREDFQVDEQSLASQLKQSIEVHL